MRLTFIFVMKIQPGHKQPYLLNMINLRPWKHVPSFYLFSCCLLWSHQSYLTSLIAVVTNIALRPANSLSQGHDNPPPTGTTAYSQKIWDTSLVSATAESFFESALDNMVRPCLLAVSTKESGDWLQALPISSLVSNIASYPPLARFKRGAVISTHINRSRTLT